MRRMFSCFVLSFILVIGLSTFAVGAKVPKVTGTWEGTGQVINLDGEVAPVQVVLVVQTQSGNLLRGYIDFDFINGDDDHFNFTGTINEGTLLLVGTNTDDEKGVVFGTLNRKKIRLQASSYTDGTVVAIVKK